MYNCNVTLNTTDPEIYDLINAEEARQNETLMMIPSENYASKEVREAVGSMLSNKYSEGYANKRYYQGNEFIDEIEKLAMDRVKKVFGVPHANVQPYSGSPANAAVLFALLNPGDKILGMALNFGGHLTHGHPKITFSGKYFETSHYTTNKDGLIDYDEVEKLAKEFKPQLIISGATAYPRAIDFKRFGEIADAVGAYHLADISHIAGLVATSVHQSPVEFAHIVMTTTHKTLRGPRGAVLMVTEKGLAKDSDLCSKIDKAVFPGLQGGPHNNTTAAIAVCMKEAQENSFKKYAKQVVENAKVLGEELTGYGFNLISGGTDNHLILIDVTNKALDGWTAAWALDYAGIVLNRNAVPFDKRSAYYPSGLRLGTPAITTRGMGAKEMKMIAKWMNEVVEITREVASKIAGADIDSEDTKVRQAARKKFRNEIQKDPRIKNIGAQIKNLCAGFPLP